MDQQAIIAGIEERAKALDVPISKLCEGARVHPTTFSRWKKSENNPEPVSATLKSLSSLTDELDRLEASKRAKAA